jgi:hypothetical protein
VSKPDPKRPPVRLNCAECGQRLSPVSDDPLCPLCRSNEDVQDLMDRDMGDS